MKPSDALAIALRTNAPEAFELAERMAHLEIGPFAAAMVRGLDAHRRREEDRARIANGGWIVELS